MSLMDIPRIYFVMVANDGCITAKGRKELATIMDTLEAKGTRYTVACG